MNYRYLGNSGLKVSELCLGTMTFGRECSEEVSVQLLDRFIEAGGNFIDCADIYGDAEEILGRWLKTKNRDDFVVITKLFWPTGKGPNDIGSSRKHIMYAVEKSLRMLDTDYIDIYMLHVWDPGTPLEETMSTLDTLVKSGKVRYLGVSNFSGWQMQKALDLSDFRGWERFICLQPLYTLLDRDIEHEIIPVCLNEGVGIIPWSPLRGGWLTGKYRKDMQEAPEGTRVKVATVKNPYMEPWETYANDHTWSILDVLDEISEETGQPLSQIALNWLLKRPGVTAPIIGARYLEQLEENLGTCEWQLSDDQMVRLNEVSSKPLPYPNWSFIADR